MENELKDFNILDEYREISVGGVWKRLVYLYPLKKSAGLAEPNVRICGEAE